MNLNEFWTQQINFGIVDRTRDYSMVEFQFTKCYNSFNSFKLKLLMVLMVTTDSTENVNDWLLLENR